MDITEIEQETNSQSNPQDIEEFIIDEEQLLEDETGEEEKLGEETLAEESKKELVISQRPKMTIKSDVVRSEKSLKKYKKLLLRYLLSIQKKNKKE